MGDSLRRRREGYVRFLPCCRWVCVLPSMLALPSTVERLLDLPECSRNRLLERHRSSRLPFGLIAVSRQSPACIPSQDFHVTPLEWVRRTFYSAPDPFGSAQEPCRPRIVPVQSGDGGESGERARCPVFDSEVAEQSQALGMQAPSAFRITLPAGDVAKTAQNGRDTRHDPQLPPQPKALIVQLSGALVVALPGGQSAEPRERGGYARVVGLSSRQLQSLGQKLGGPVEFSLRGGDIGKVAE